MSDFEVCPVGTLQRLAQAEAERDSMREILDHIPQVEAELEETSDRLHAAEARADRAEQCAETEAKRADKAEAEFERLKRCVAFQEQTYLKHHGGSWGNCKYKSERDALLALIVDDGFAASFQTMAQYRSALLKATKGGGNG